MKMTKEEALKKIDELVEYVKELDNATLTEKDIVAFNIFELWLDVQTVMLVPIYGSFDTVLFGLSGRCGCIGATYSDELRTREQMLKYLLSVGAKRSTKTAKFVNIRNIRKEVQLEDIVAFNQFGQTDVIAAVTLIPVFDDKFTLSGLDGDVSKPYLIEPKTAYEMFKYLRKSNVTRPIGRLEVATSL